MKNVIGAKGNYIIHFGLIASGIVFCAWLFADNSWQGSYVLHLLVELLAIFLAVGAGILMLRSYHSIRPDIALLVMGAGLLGTGILDSFHVALAFESFANYFPSRPEVLMLWSWLVSRCYLGLMMFLGWVAWRRYRLMGPDNGVSPILVYIGAATTIAISIFIFASITLPEAHYSGGYVGRPWELLAAVLFGLALAMLIRKGGWTQNAFEYWLVISLVIHVAIQAAVIAFSSVIYDSLYIFSHVLKAIAYLCMWFAVLSSKNIWTAKESPVFSLLPDVSKATFHPGRVGGKLLLLITALVMLSVGSLIITNIDRQSQQISQQVMQSLDGIASTQKQAIQQITNQYLSHLRIIKGRVDIQKKLEGIQNAGTSDAQVDSDIRMLEKSLEDLVLAETSIKNITLYDLSGHSVVSVGELWIEMVNAATIDIPRIDTMVGLSNIEGDYIVRVAAPVQYEGELIGAIQMWVDASSIRSILMSAHILGSTSESVFGYKNDSGYMTLMSPYRVRPEVGVEPVPDNLPSRQDDQEYPMQQAYKGVEGILEYAVADYNGNTVYAVLRHIPELHSGLVVKIDASEIEKRVQSSLNHNLLIGFIILVFALLVGWLSAHLLMSPLAGLTRIARDLGNGNREIALELHTRDEFGLLAKTLNDSSKQILAREVALNDERVRQRAVLDNMLDAVMRINSKGEILYCNPSCTRMFGYSADELIGNNITMLMGEPHRSQHDGYLHHHLKTGEKKIIGLGREVTALRKDGSEIPVHLSVSRFDIEGQPMFAGILHELTETKNFEAELKQQNQALIDANNELEQFAYITSHDLKSPLRAVDNLVQWILEDLQDFELPDEVSRNLGRLRERANTMEQMIQELLVYSRAGSNNCALQEINTYELVNQVIYDLEPNDAFSFEVDEDLPVTVTSKAALELVFRNLIGNAIKHHDKPYGVIRVSGELHESICIFSVCDDGPGINPSFESKVFQIFQTLQPKAKTNSTGMGLALVKRTVESCGGSIAMLSSVGVRGTCFEFSWPVNDHSVNEQVSEQEVVV